MAQALACQAAGDYPGMARALGPWQDDATLDDRSRIHALLWRPLLAEGLIGSGQTGPAAVVLGCLRRDAGQASYLQPALAWLEGWLAEQSGDIGQAREIYRRGERETCPGGEMAGQSSPLYAARLLLAYGRLLRRTGDRPRRPSGWAGPTRCSMAWAPDPVSPGPQQSWPDASSTPTRPSRHPRSP